MSANVADWFFYFYFYQILTTLNNLKIMSKVTHGKWLKLQSNSDVSNTMDRSNCFLVPVNFAVNSLSISWTSISRKKVELFYDPVKIFVCIYMFHIIVYLIEETTCLEYFKLAIRNYGQPPETTVCDSRFQSYILWSKNNFCLYWVLQEGSWKTTNACTMMI